jgi:hypothetical protein
MKKLYNLRDNPEVRFEEQEHKYIVDNKTVVSATQVLKANGLSPVFEGVPNEVLVSAADKGTNIHSLFEQINESRGDVTHLFIDGDFGAYAKAIDDAKIWERYSEYKAETILYSKRLGMAGRVDFIGVDKDNGSTCICDLKSGNPDKMDFWYAAWQLSLYAEMLKDETGLIADKLSVYYFPVDKEGNMCLEERDLTGWVPTKNLMELEEAIITGELYSGMKECIDVEDRKDIILFHDLARKFSRMSFEVDRLKEDYDRRKKAICKVMEKNHIYSCRLEPDVLISYVKPYERRTVESKRLKEDMPDVFNKYSKIASTEATIRVKIKTGDASNG